MGVPAFGTVPREKFRDHHFPVDRHPRGAGASFGGHSVARRADPQPLPYLDSPQNREAGAIDIRLEALLQTAKMRRRGEPPQRLSQTSFRHSYWTIAQLVAHHTLNGCNLRSGDLFGSGTQSGPEAAEAGSLVELSRGGSQALAVGGDEQRTFLEDGDTVVFRGWCEREGAATIGFGEVSGQVLPAIAAP